MVIEVFSEESIFHMARKIDSIEARQDYLDQVCCENVELRKRVTALLEIHDGEKDFLCSPSAVIATFNNMSMECPGMHLGPYKLIEQIGEGAFGLVFQAEQLQPVRRHVAIKILKPGMDSLQVIARFEAERQALALMDHVNIARVLDAGETASGRPFFAMELARGLPITEYCDKNGLAPRARLELFLTVCQAVQHAHHKGIIHRDLKPSNILVTLHDGEAVAKVIDFGIAKAIGQQLTDRILYTGVAQMIGTPLYMSPEQAEMSGLDIDTRSDIYSLGVLLYELMTGSTPFDKERLSKAGYDEIRRIIRDEDPAKPSSRLSTLGEAATVVSSQRQSDPKRLSQFLKGELDWIVMKSLEKERSRRYETVAAFALDIERYLHDDPVSACPPSTWYRFGKMARRHKATLIAATLVSLALIIGSAVSMWQAIRATDAANSEHQALLNLGKEQQATQRELFESLVAQARANRLSRRLGQRFRTLELVSKATVMAHELGLADRFLELRNEAIAALAMPDLRVAKEWPTAVDHAIYFDANLNHYAHTDQQGNVEVRSVENAKVLYNLPRIGPGENYPALSPDGNYLAVFEFNKSWLYVWKLSGDKPSQVKNMRAIGRVSFSPDSRHLAVQKLDLSICLIELDNAEKEQLLPNSQRASQIDWHPNGKWLAIACKTFVQVRDLESGTVLWQKDLAPNAYRWAKWHPDGKILAVEDGEAICLWNVRQDKMVGRLDGNQGGGLNFAFNPAGSVLVNTGWAGVLRLWDPQSGRLLFSTNARIQSPETQLSTDGRFLAAIQHNKNVGIWEIAAANEYRTLVASPLKARTLYGSISISPDGHFLVASGVNGGIGLWDLATGRELALLDGSHFNHVAFALGSTSKSEGLKHGVTLLTMQADGLFRRTISIDSGSGIVSLEPTQKLRVPSKDAMFAQSADGRVLASAQFEGALVLHADQPDNPIKLEPHNDVRHVAVSPDGQWVATGRFNIPGGIKIWQLDKQDADELKYKFVKELPSFGLSLPRFSPDGKRLLATSVAASLPIRRWDVETWSEIPFVESIDGQYATYSPDGKVIVLETGTGIARLVDADNGKEYARLEDPDQHRTHNFAFSPDGRTLACASEDGYCVHVWDLQLIHRQLAEMNLDWTHFK